VILLFEAFLAMMLAEKYDKLSRPLLTLEEPEAHLHPCAIRSLWAVLEVIVGQKIIATHSGDLLARTPLAAIRRFFRKDGVISVGYVKPGTLSEEERRRIDFHLQSSRGELLFARCWLLGEGESEYWVFKEAADILGYDLDRLGIRVVNTRYSGTELLVKVANDLGIAWYFVGDGDDQGRKDKEICNEHLQGRKANKHLCVLDQPNIEVLLCESGFGHIYEKHISNQKRHLISAAPGSTDYWPQVVSAQPNKDKPARIREVMDEMRAGGSTQVPEKLKAIIESAIALAGTQA
jgi:putative ATP-dependent endonuclease of OLD family